MTNITKYATLDEVYTRLIDALPNDTLKAYLPLIIENIKGQLGTAEYNELLALFVVAD